VASFPDIDQLLENPYWSILRTGLRDLDVEFSPRGSGFGGRWLRANRSSVDVLHFHFVQQFYAYESTGARLRWVVRFARNLILAGAWGYRTVFTLHNLRPTYPLQPTWVDYLGHWVAVNLTQRVIVHCEAARDALAGRYGRRRNVHVVWHPHLVGVYPDEMPRDEARLRLGLGADDLVLLFFGGIRPNKGIESLINAFAQLPGKSLRLVIAGKQWRPPEYLEALTRLIAQDNRIELREGFVPVDDVQIFQKSADVVVLPFSSILTSTSAMLALSFGRPVVVPATGCLPELVTEGVGFLYDPADEDSLRLTLQRCTHDELSSMGRRALERVQEASWQGFAEQTLAAYGVRE
jgi:glycosyltransferase involved in cell wall biosynthesis